MGRRDYLTHSVTHYLLAIHKLYEANERSRYVDIANAINVAKSSVTVAVKKLKANGLVDEDKNKNLFLTEKGHKDVHDTLANRTLLFYFFKDILHVSNKVADEDACRIEHLISSETQKKLFELLRSFSACKDSPPISIKDLDLCFCDYKSLNDFKKSQVGDSHLQT